MCDAVLQKILSHECSVASGSITPPCEIEWQPMTDGLVEEHTVGGTLVQSPQVGLPVPAIMRSILYDKMMVNLWGG